MVADLDVQDAVLHLVGRHLVWQPHQTPHQVVWRVATRQDDAEVIAALGPVALGECFEISAVACQERPPLRGGISKLLRV